jgi:hypothetical protein
MNTNALHRAVHFFRLSVRRCDKRALDMTVRNAFSFRIHAIAVRTVRTYVRTYGTVRCAVRTSVQYARTCTCSACGTCSTVQYVPLRARYVHVRAVTYVHYVRCVLIRYRCVRTCSTCNAIRAMQCDTSRYRCVRTCVHDTVRTCVQCVRTLRCNAYDCDAVRCMRCDACDACDAIRAVRAMRCRCDYRCDACLTAVRARAMRTVRYVR